MLLFIGGGEVVFILLIVVMLFGADKIPELARGLAKGMKEIKHASNEIKREINSQTGGMADMAKDIKSTADQGRQQVQNLKGSVSRQMNQVFEDQSTEDFSPDTSTSTNTEKENS